MDCPPFPFHPLPLLCMPCWQYMRKSQQISLGRVRRRRQREEKHRHKTRPKCTQPEEKSNSESGGEIKPNRPKQLFNRLSECSVKYAAFKIFVLCKRMKIVCKWNHYNQIKKLFLCSCTLFRSLACTTWVISYTYSNLPCGYVFERDAMLRAQNGGARPHKMNTLSCKQPHTQTRSQYVHIF